MNIPITPQQLPSGFCPQDYQGMWNAFAAAGYVTLPDSLAQIVKQASKPTDSTVVWIQLDGLGRPVRTYTFAQGAWLSLHPQVPGQTVWWFSALPDFTLFDGGDANPLTDISGPMWQKALDSNGNLISAKFPLTQGTLPSGTTVNLGNTGGEENHILQASEIPAHTHFMATAEQVQQPTVDNSPSNLTALTNVAAANNANGGRTSQYALWAGTSGVTPSVGPTGTVGGGLGHNTMPPYVVGYLLQRTSRLYYAVN